jgi:hypothetical protein
MDLEQGIKALSIFGNALILIDSIKRTINNR